MLAVTAIDAFLRVSEFTHCHNLIVVSIRLQRNDLLLTSPPTSVNRGICHTANPSSNAAELISQTNSSFLFPWPTYTALALHCTTITSCCREPQSLGKGVGKAPHSPFLEQLLYLFFFFFFFGFSTFALCGVRSRHSKLDRLLCRRRSSCRCVHSRQQICVLVAITNAINISRLLLLPSPS